LNGQKTFDEPIKVVDPEWNDWLAENQHLVEPMLLMYTCPLLNFFQVYLATILKLRYFLRPMMPLSNSKGSSRLFFTSNVLMSKLFSL
jgi:hypothetical protein